ncbi:MAG: alanine--glyoxylate aminotransferase family protein [Chloroflexi bacterium]|nr:alanine--glyoxylate aminotransferase family protein [Chloroflexota bacterium]
MAVNLRIPGPTPCPEEVLEAGAKPMINHRGPEFREMINRITERLQKLFYTKNDLFVLTASGTGAMEAAIVNTLSPGDRVLVVSIGEFGERFAAVARAYWADVVDLKFEPGTPADPDAIRKVLAADPRIKAVLVTHNETSTGITNDIPAISKVVKGEFNKLFIVDAISSIGSIPCPVDEWNLDVVTSGSQKGWMAPPGLAFISMSETAWKAQAQARMPRFYFDLAAAKRYLQRGQTPWTPAVSVFFALDASLELIDKEGMESVFTRHAVVAKKTREGVKSLGLKLLADERYASNTVTAVRVPEGVKAADIISRMDKEENVVLASGQGKLDGKIFRVGHLGYCSEADIQGVIDGLKRVLPMVGYKG